MLYPMTSSLIIFFCYYLANYAGFMCAIVEVNITELFYQAKGCA